MDSSDRCNRPTKVYKMMQRLGLETAGSVLPQLGLIYASAVRTCHQCEQSDACREWFKVAPTTLQLAPTFCPNRDLLCQLAFDQPSAWSTKIVHWRDLPNSA